MKLLTATLLAFTALTSAAMAETQAERQMHSYDYVSQVSTPMANTTPAMAPESAPAQGKPMHHKKHHGKHHAAKKAHAKKHAKKVAKPAAAPAPAAQ